MRGTRERGAALLVAMLLVATVATLSAASLWKHWSGIEVEAAERARVQSAWILTGALDWARLILREDARSGAVDHLDEPWAVPLNEARLASFLESGASPVAVAEADTAAAFLSGRIVDLQSKLNVSRLAANGQISEPVLRSFTRLFGVLGLPQSELARLAENLRQASDLGPHNPLAGAAPVPAQQLDHLADMGLPPATIAAIEPHVAMLPGKTAVNLNTASAEVIYSAIDGITMADAQRLVAGRGGAPFRTVGDAAAVLGGGVVLPDREFAVGSRFFEVRSRLRMGPLVVQEQAVVQRDGGDVVVLQRGRGAAAPP